ncbi:MAG: SufB/SufD family protein [Acidimicrobiales bacterium]
MNDRFSPAAVGEHPDQTARRAAAERAVDRGLPSIETEEWRYSPIGDLDPAGLRPATPADVPAADADPLAATITDRAATVTLVNGTPSAIDVASGWSARGLTVELDPARRWAPTGSDPARPRGPADREDPEAEETLFDLWHQAFSPGAVVVRVPDGVIVDAPVVIVNRSSGGEVASFSHLVVEAGNGAEVSVVEHAGTAAPGGLSVPVVELRADDGAVLTYELLQEHDRTHWTVGRQRSSAADRGRLVSAVAAFGARYARTRTDSRLLGRRSRSEMTAAYYGDGEQIHDFRVFQHHEAADTRSDLLFKGAQDDASGSIYSGMIHIHPEGSGTDAFQTNRNVKLSPDAWAWSVPNLEIENNDVRCSHASTVSPVDPDQQFYLHSRGVPPVEADRLIVEGFFDQVIDRFPTAAVRARIEGLVADELNRRPVTEPASREAHV